MPLEPLARFVSLGRCMSSMGCCFFFSFVVVCESLVGVFFLLVLSEILAGSSLDPYMCFFEFFLGQKALTFLAEGPGKVEP